jgi:hypothetical protein
MVLQCHDPVHQHSKWISLPQFPKINEVNLEPHSIMETSNWFSASLGRLGDRILLEANNTTFESLQYGATRRNTTCREDMIGG